MIKTQQEVESFLRHFMPKFDIFGIFFLNREKNERALLALGITRKYREEVVRSIEVSDYVETISDAVSYGVSNTICISFHEAEHPINYAFKK